MNVIEMFFFVFYDTRKIAKRNWKIKSITDFFRVELEKI